MSNKDYNEKYNNLDLNNVNIHAGIISNDNYLMKSHIVKYKIFDFVLIFQ